jgi:glycogen(starch) synthase
MRILYQCNGLPPGIIGGAEIFSMHFVEQMHRRGHDIRVVTSHDNRVVTSLISGGGEASPYRCSAPVIKLPFTETFLGGGLHGQRQTFQHLEAILASFHPEVIHLNDVREAGFFFLRRSEFDIPRLVTLHGPLKTAGIGGLEGRVIAEADRAVAVSEALGVSAAQAYPAARAKLSVIRNALPFPAIAPAPLPFDPPVVLCLGRLSAEKGFDVALEAFANVHAASPGRRLWIAGNGPERKTLEAQAESLGIGHHVEFTGWIEPWRVPDLLNRATIVLMPSKWAEPFGLVALQAGQMGRPVIATATGGLPEIVDDGETGLLVPVGDVDAVAGALRQLLASPESALAMGRQARVRTQDRFSFERLLDAYEEAYRDAIAGHGRGLVKGSARVAQSRR